MELKLKKIFSVLIVASVLFCTVFSTAASASENTGSEASAYSEEYGRDGEVLYNDSEEVCANEDEEESELSSQNFEIEPSEAASTEVSEEQTTEVSEEETTEVSEEETTEVSEEETTQPAATAATQPATQPTTSSVPTVGNVKNVKKSGSQTNSITLTWSKTSGATGYVVYICNHDKTTKYTKLGYTKNTEYTAKKLADTTAYYFKVAAYVQQNGVKYEGKATVKKTATSPSKPNIANKTASKTNKITWTKNTKATGYIIYRSSAKTNGKYVKYKVIKNSDTNYLYDSNVTAGRAYNYKVVTYRTLYGSATYHSKSSSILRTIASMYAVKFTTKTQLSRVSLSWTKNKYAHGYEIFYATSKNGTYKRLGYTKNNFYNTKKLTNGKTYYFRVRPYKLINNKKVKVVGSYYTKAQKVSNKAFGKSVGTTYVEISIKQQHMWYYKNGKLVVETDVVTGNADGYHNTPTGVYKIMYKQSPATLMGSHVDYWMPFTSSGCGIHDASWRSSDEYGGTTYKTNGSHGCVNTPYSAVKKIYKNISAGAYVVVYN